MWTDKNNSLVKEFTFKNFSEAFAFMTRVALIAEKLGHHPTWTNTWNKVTISLTSHSAGNIITEKDIQMSQLIDRLLV